ncbi:MAG: flagellar basal body L-ring protein FlgH, partial [Betaproteobacteria bacterium]|nr:flagellar basal body L-ring protein FlgH [Betaproteobacteria bacterium]
MTSLNQFQAGFRRIGQWLAATLLLGLSACTTALPPQAMTHSPMFEPVYPVQNPRDSLATGAIYVGRQSDSWFGKGRNFQVGDV